MVTLVIGGTGRCGKPLVLRLLELGHEVRVLTRSPTGRKARSLAAKGARLFCGDLGRPDMDTSAFDGIENLVLITSPESGFREEVEAGAHALEVADKHGVRHLVLQSVSLADTGIPHCDTKKQIERLLQATSIPHTILRPAIFLEVLEPFLGAWMQSEEDWLYVEFPLKPDRPANWIAVEDIAEATARVVTAGRPRGRTYDLAMPETLSLNQITDALARISGGRRLDFEYQPLSLYQSVKNRLGQERAEEYLRGRTDLEEDYYGPLHTGEGLADPTPFAAEFDFRFTCLEEYLRACLDRDAAQRSS